MINLQFNSLCPFCNITLSTKKDYNNIFTCNNCVNINNIQSIYIKYYDVKYCDGKLQYIDIEMNNDYCIEVDFYSNRFNIYIFSPNEKRLDIHLPDFSSIQDIISISETLCLFQ